MDFFRSRQRKKKESSHLPWQYPRRENPSPRETCADPTTRRPCPTSRSVRNVTNRFCPTTFALNVGSITAERSWIKRSPESSGPLRVKRPEGRRESSRGLSPRGGIPSRASRKPGFPPVLRGVESSAVGIPQGPGGRRPRGSETGALERPTPSGGERYARSS